MFSKLNKFMLKHNSHIVLCVLQALKLIIEGGLEDAPKSSPYFMHILLILDTWKES